MGKLYVLTKTFSYLSTVPLFSADYRVHKEADSVCAGDLGLDGDKDIEGSHIFCNRVNRGGLSIMHNDGRGVFTLM